MRPVTRWRRSGSRFGWLPLGLAAVVLTAVLASVALAQSPELEPPGRPQALQAAVVSHDMVSLSWDDPGDATISGYQILRRLRDHSPVGQFEVLVEDTGSAASAYVDRQVQPETRYNYRVKARNAAGLSPRSNFVRADTPPAPVLKQAKQEQQEQEEQQEEQQEDQQEDQQEPEEQVDELVTVWTGQLTVGVFSAAAPPVRGYAEWIRQGALAPRDFSFADESYTVLGLFEHGGGLNLVLGRPLPHDFVLELGPRRYESSQSLEPVFVWAGRYWWPDTTLDWAAKATNSRVSIILDPSTTASQRAAAPPSAYLTELPAAHNGRDPFALKLVFDEPDLPLTAALLRDHALQVSGGSAAGRRSGPPGQGLADHPAAVGRRAADRQLAIAGGLRRFGRGLRSRRAQAARPGDGDDRGTAQTGGPADCGSDTESRLRPGHRAVHGRDRSRTGHGRGRRRRPQSPAHNQPGRRRPATGRPSGRAGGRGRDHDRTRAEVGHGRNGARLLGGPPPQRRQRRNHPPRDSTH